ncbi:aspartyl protease family protein [Dysgonomonas sp. Marseille-P4361]|uniref:aspartyl protease family protein n=1 Tax=Dysgonomonas sp. Marseille-P4361 TaxID=2161820 RepID=UPI000D55F1FA|nr:aspartyl protease family protein [Dysgonomonas sp. Marseille-P4361]
MQKLRLPYKQILTCLFIVFSSSCTKKNDNNTIPFEKDGCFYIKAVLNDSIEGRFVFDTGADGLYLDSTFLNKHKSLAILASETVRMRGAGSTDYKEISLLKDSIKVTISDSYIHTFTDIPIFKLTDINGDDIAGIIGNEFIKNQVLCVDNENLTLSITPSVNKKDYNIEIPFEYDDGRIYFPLKIWLTENTMVEPRLLMDLGCGESVIFNTPFYKTIKGNIENSITYTILHGGALGGNSNGGEFRASSMSIGECSLHNPLLSYSIDTLGAFSKTEYDGLLGNQVLDRFNYAIDYKNNRLYLSQNNKYKEPFNSTLTGFYAMKRSDFATVESIYYQSEAHQNGLQLGDTIIKINNKDIGGLTDSEFYNILRNRDKVILTITRNEKESKISFTPKYLL